MFNELLLRKYDLFGGFKTTLTVLLVKYANFRALLLYNCWANHNGTFSDCSHMYCEHPLQKLALYLKRCAREHNPSAHTQNCSPGGKDPIIQKIRKLFG